MTPVCTPTKFNHMSFPTQDVLATSTFFERYLGFSASMTTPNFAILKRPGFDIVIERAASDAPTVKALGASRSNAFADCVGESPTEATWPMAFHIGLELPTLDDVRALRDQLVADGFDAETEIFNNDRGSRFFLRAPGGVMVEFTTRADAAEEFRGTFN